MGVESRITSKGQTTIPAEVRRALGVGAGDLIRYEINGDEVRLVKKRSALEIAGVFHDPARKAVSIEDMDQAIAEAREERSGRSLDRR